MIGLFTGCAAQQEEITEGEIPEEVLDETEKRYPLEITDGLGYDIIIEAKPERIISISPSQTEILYALGLGDRLVGVSDYCDYPEEALTKEKVGSSWTVNVERIIELMPDVVFTFGDSQPEAMQQIAAAGITVVRYVPESIDEIFETMRSTGEITDTVAEAESVIAEMAEKRDAIINAVAGRETIRVFYQMWDEPLMTAGPSSFIDELIVLAGGENIAGDAQGAYPQYSVEVMVEKDPEVFLAPAHMGDETDLTEEQEQELIKEIKSRPGYSEITAIKEDRVEVLEPNVVSRPGARIIEAFEVIAKAVHPDLF